jgi:hypothetical protein
MKEKCVEFRALMLTEQAGLTVNAPHPWFRKTWKKAEVVNYKVHFKCLLGGAKENHEDRQSVQHASR